MKAVETSLDFLSGQQTQFVIPFFQRAYVWDEDNWQRLLDSLISTASSHFLGSIIVKNNAVVNSNGFYTYSVIDGQQRITTISILMRALIDNLNTSVVGNTLKAMLFCKHSAMYDYDDTLADGEKNGVVKLVHGFHDKSVFTALIEDPITAVTSYPDNQVIKCYNFFKESTSDPIIAEKIYTLLVNQQIKFIVKIELDLDDNAQAIFDVTNGTGVSLTCADIIKNDLFMHIDESNRLNKYNSSWADVFDGTDYDFWTSIYNSRTNIENLLFAIAQITDNGTGYIYDATCDTFEKLSDKYRTFFSSRSQIEITAFVDDLMKYAKIYKKYFTVEDDYSYDYSEKIPRYMLSFSNLNACTVLFPFLLKLFEPNCDDNGEIIPDSEDNVLSKLEQMERLLIRAAIVQNLDFSTNPGAKPSNKNFNKQIVNVINTMEPNNLFTLAQLGIINDNDLISAGLKKISNNTAKIILFLLNLDIVNRLGSTTAMHSFVYHYELEHIMPQEFATYWGMPTVDSSGNNLTIGTEADYRKSFVYQIGNMTLITPKANKTIKNYNIYTKMNGDTTRITATGNIRKGYHGYILCANEPISQQFKADIVSAGYVWNEAMINKRTESLTNDVLRIWA